MEATICSLTKLGYSDTTTTKFVAEAGFPHGAVLDHFKNGGALIQSTIGAFLGKRLRPLRCAPDNPAPGH
ncbi:MAG: hypothetical protein APF78_03775 [Sphingomonadales bacterium BRH_c3]|nr:MAG: hypothetical protein APF78_03775 [Sphingomonadales bacterium BRH_c3]